MRHPKSIDHREIRRHYPSKANGGRPVDVQEIEELRIEKDFFNHPRPWRPVLGASGGTRRDGPRPRRGCGERIAPRFHTVSSNPPNSHEILHPEGGDLEVPTDSHLRRGVSAERGSRGGRPRLPVWGTLVLLAGICLLTCAACLSLCVRMPDDRSTRQPVLSQAPKGSFDNPEGQGRKDQSIPRASMGAFSASRPVLSASASLRPHWPALSEPSTRSSRGFGSQPAMSEFFRQASTTSAEGEPIMQLVAFPSQSRPTRPDLDPLATKDGGEWYRGMGTRDHSFLTRSLARIDTQLGKLDVQGKEYDLLLNLIASRRVVFRGFIPEGQAPELSFLPIFQSKIVELEIKKRALAVRYKPKSREIRAVAQEIDGVRDAMKEYVGENRVFVKKQKETLMARRAELEGLLQTMRPIRKAERAPNLRKTFPARAAPAIFPRQNNMHRASAKRRSGFGMT